MTSIQAIIDNIEQVIIGKRAVIEKLVTALLCGGHVLIEDAPGVGKTTLAKALARSIDCTFSRIQFTPDLMPSDITGSSVYDRNSGEFRFVPGPIVSNMVLADEINRASPKTQSSLLEAMEERQITVDGRTIRLEEPFMVIATQNPVEYEGTFPLPEAQLDRFMMCLNIGYPSADDEVRILRIPEHHQLLEELKPVAAPCDILSLREQITRVNVSDAVARYIVGLSRTTRSLDDISLGVSPRASRDLYAAAQAFALLKGRDYVLPDDVKYLFPTVCGHRIKLSSSARLRGITTADAVNQVLRMTAVPVVR